MPLPNIDPKTGTHYGIVSANALDDEMVHYLMFECRSLVDHSYNDAVEEIARELGYRPVNSLAFNEGWINSDEEAEDAGEVYASAVDVVEVNAPGRLECIDIDERIVSGECDGVRYITSWLGGALHFFITRSSWVAHNVPACSPCVPNAGDIDRWLEGCEGGVSAYIPPLSWIDRDSAPCSWRTQIEFEDNDDVGMEV